MPRRTKAQIGAARKRSEAARKANLRTRHHMTLEQYDQLLEIQDGVCYICRRAKGTTRRLSVDHDHAYAKEHCSHPHDESCEDCWRGLLCSTCNRMLAHARDLIEFFQRAMQYLLDPPARLWRTKYKYGDRK